MDKTDQPVRLGGWAALAVGLALQGVILFAAGTPPLAIAGALAALLLAAVPGLEWVRAHVTPWPLPPEKIDAALDELPPPGSRLARRVTDPRK